MAKQIWKAGNMLYPLPAVLVTCSDGVRDNVFTVSWAGTVCTDPPMVSISVRPQRYSHELIRKSREFVIALTTGRLAAAADYCGVASGRAEDKFAAAHLTREKASLVGAPLIAESPVNIECRVKQIIPLGSHDLFLAEVAAVQVDEAYLDARGRLDLQKADLLASSHGEYFTLGKRIGRFGYSVRKSSARSAGSLPPAGNRQPAEDSARKHRSGRKKENLH